MGFSGHTFESHAGNSIWNHNAKIHQQAQDTNGELWGLVPVSIGSSGPSSTKGSVPLFRSSLAIQISFEFQVQVPSWKNPVNLSNSAANLYDQTQENITVGSFTPTPTSLAVTQKGRQQKRKIKTLDIKDRAWATKDFMKSMEQKALLLFLKDFEYAASEVRRWIIPGVEEGSEQEQYVFGYLEDKKKNTQRRMCQSEEIREKVRYVLDECHNRKLLMDDNGKSIEDEEQWYDTWQKFMTKERSYVQAVFLVIVRDTFDMANAYSQYPTLKRKRDEEDIIPDFDRRHLYANLKSMAVEYFPDRPQLDGIPSKVKFDK
ncbi:hypothetical protein BDV96DRAFT_655785 [Lophiotrema nucula]|uniref:Uncharacterized protein n=1 Tax=Lophiotrema nucula TaxID=690887 RepID=A0A6A5YDA0_9PLEO|nr:hypothetical protein BDV96DRAFT_655785 [Lophiotrema nucula]